MGGGEAGTQSEGAAAGERSGTALRAQDATSVTLAAVRKGVKNSRQASELYMAVMDDLLTGRITPGVANTAVGIIGRVVNAMRAGLIDVVVVDDSREKPSADEAAILYCRMEKCRGKYIDGLCDACGHRIAWSKKGINRLDD